MPRYHTCWRRRDGRCELCNSYDSRYDQTLELASLEAPEHQPTPSQVAMFTTEPEERRSILVEALDRLGIKADEYGMPENSFSTIAAFWNVYIEAKKGAPLTADDGPAMLILMKLARKVNGAGKRDNWRDIGGYAHCGDVLENGEKDEK